MRQKYARHRADDALIDGGAFEGDSRWFHDNKTRPVRVRRPYQLEREHYSITDDEEDLYMAVVRAPGSDIHIRHPFVNKRLHDVDDARLDELDDRYLAGLLEHPVDPLVNVRWDAKELGGLNRENATLREFLSVLASVEAKEIDEDSERSRGPYRRPLHRT